MQDFIRIGGPIVSSPLNENFRRMANAIDMANTNMIFSNEDGVKNTIDDMLNIVSPLDGQVCYVISSGEFYRYSKGDNQWHKIMDLGNTFRQGFLNSGAVIFGDYITRKDDTTFTLPDMLLYFKNKEGDGKYLGGMYLITEHDIDISDAAYNITTAGAYSIYSNELGTCTFGLGMPTGDTVDTVFLGVILVNSDLHIVQFIDGNDEVIGDGVYTIPDMAYTGDRGHFLVDGGKASGLNLAVTGSGVEAKISRMAGYYYDEGMGCTIADTSEFPAATDNRSNFNVKRFEAIPEVTNFIYLYPSDAFNKPIEVKNGIVYNAYVRNGELEPIANGFFTIQQHLVLPDGNNVILYGDKVYNSFDDAYAHINDIFGVDIDFAYVEASRLIVGTDTSGNFDITNPELFKIVGVGRLSQIGTFTPEFSDSEFKVYSADAGDNTPSSVKFDLLNLQADNYQSGVGFGLVPLHWNVTRDYTGSGTISHNRLYLRDGEYSNITVPSATQRTFTGKTGAESGYELADNTDLTLLANRLAAVEKEIWEEERSLNNQIEALYKQSVRYRLYKDELHLTSLDDSINSINTEMKKKVNKDTTINGITLGDNNADKDEAKTIVLYTNDISEPSTNIINKWFTEQRVRDVDYVSAAYQHANKRGTGVLSDANPHAMSTNDITVPTPVQPADYDVRNQFISANERTSWSTSPINVYGIPGTSTETTGEEYGGAVKTVKFYDYGFNVNVGNNIATIEIDHNDVLTRAEYASASLDPRYAGTVDRALLADNVTALDNADINQYYGTDENGNVGVFDLPVYVSTADAEEYTSADDVAFEPIDHSVVLKHLANSRVTYPASYEETILGTNVYDLVKNHFHKVYNSGTQGPYISGTTTQDTSAIYYSYKVPAGGLAVDTYYFSYGNSNFSFTTSAVIAANKELKYTPSTDTLSLDGTTITKTAVQPEDVDEEKWLSFVSRTDWNNINEWNFGDNLTVTVTDNKATINANVAGSGASNFANLGDVDVTYNESNLGKMLVLDKDASNNYKIKFGEAGLAGYMKTVDYAYDAVHHVVKKANEAALADVAETANKLQNTYTVNDASPTATTLWSSSKIVSDVSTQIQNEGVRTYNGTTEPDDSLGKDGDLYILLES